MEPLKLKNLASWCGGKACNVKLLERTCTGVSTDTRTLKRGDLFIAIRGASFDGHDFAVEAILKGAVAVVVSEKIPKAGQNTITVSDTLQALGDMARGYRRSFSPYIVGITGSDGKTTTKEFLKKVLSTSYRVAGTEGNLNNQIGLPLSVLDKVDRRTDICILEMGMNSKGEIKYLSGIAEPQAGVITNIACAHIGFFKNAAEIAEAKAELIENLTGKERLCVLNRDSRFFDFLKSRSRQSTIRSFGTKRGADIRGVIREEGTGFFTFSVGDDNFLYRMNYWNASIIYPALVSLVFARRFSLSRNIVAEVLEATKPLPGRGMMHAGAITVIDDTYNSNPNSLQHALTAFSRKNFKRKIAVLGDMAELGRFSSFYHRNTGLLLRRLDIDMVITFGDKSRIISETAGGGCRHFSDIAQLTASLKKIVRKHDALLVKGSRSMGMERVVASLLE